MSVKRPVVAILLSCLLACAHVHAGLLQTLGPNTPWGVEGHSVVGAGNTYPFVYDDVTRTYTNIPVQYGGARGISGNLIVGGYPDFSLNSHGFLYNTTTQTYLTLSDPLAGSGGYAGNGNYYGTMANGIDGNNVVGSYVDAAGKQHGFLYDIGDQTWTTLDYPRAFSTTLSDISENYIVGYYSSSGFGPARALIYDRMASTWSTFGSSGMEAFGIDGDKVVGGVDGGGAGGWLYNIST